MRAKCGGVEVMLRQGGHCTLVVLFEVGGQVLQNRKGLLGWVYAKTREKHAKNSSAK